MRILIRIPGATSRRISIGDQNIMLGDPSSMRVHPLGSVSRTLSICQSNRQLKTKIKIFISVETGEVNYKRVIT